MHRTLELKQDQRRNLFYTNPEISDRGPGNLLPVPSKKPRYPAPNSNFVHIRRVFSDTPNSPHAFTTPDGPTFHNLSKSQDQPQPPELPPKSSNALAIILRKKEGVKTRQKGLYETPPIPPKTEDESDKHDDHFFQKKKFNGSLGRNLSCLNVTESAAVSLGGYDHTFEGQSSLQTPGFRTILPSGKWAPQVLNFEERIRQRKQVEQRRKEDIEEAQRDEILRIEKSRQLKEEQKRQEIQEEERRRMDIKEELIRAARERKLKEQTEEYEESLKHLELEERKRLERSRRMKEHRRLDNWRKEQEIVVNNATKEAEEARKKEKLERERKIQIAKAKVREGDGSEERISGWLTMQTNDYVAWKRRFYKFEGSTMYLYRSSHDITHKVELKGKIKAVLEWNEGYEDLKSIPFSFAVEFVSGVELSIWSVYADSEDEKYRLLGLLHNAAGF